MDITKTNNVYIAGTLENSDESGIIAYSEQVYYETGKKSVKDAIDDQTSINNSQSTILNTHSSNIMKLTNDITTLNAKVDSISGGGSGMVWE